MAKRKDRVERAADLAARETKKAFVRLRKYGNRFDWRLKRAHALELDLKKQLKEGKEPDPATEEALGVQLKEATAVANCYFNAVAKMNETARKNHEFLMVDVANNPTPSLTEELTAGVRVLMEQMGDEEREEFLAQMREAYGGTPSTH